MYNRFFAGFNSCWGTGSGDDWQRKTVALKRQAITCRSLDKKTWYEFTIETTDSSGLKSLAASPVQLRTYDRGIRNGVSGFSGALSEDKKLIALKWSGNFKPGTRFLIYRQVPGASGFTKYKVVKDVNEFLDNSISAIGEYKYTIKALHPDGGESLPEESVSVFRNLN